MITTGSDVFPSWCVWLSLQNISDKRSCVRSTANQQSSCNRGWGRLCQIWWSQLEENGMQAGHRDNVHFMHVYCYFSSRASPSIYTSWRRGLNVTMPLCVEECNNGQSDMRSSDTTHPWSTTFAPAPASTWYIGTDHLDERICMAKAQNWKSPSRCLKTVPSLGL